MAFTVVFEGNISDLKRNPLKIESEFGKVVACGVGNAFDVVENMIEVEEAAQKLVEVLANRLD